MSDIGHNLRVLLLYWLVAISYLQGRQLGALCDDVNPKSKASVLLFPVTNE